MLVRRKFALGLVPSSYSGTIKFQGICRGTRIFLSGNGVHARLRRFERGRRKGRTGSTLAFRVPQSAEWKVLFRAAKWIVTSCHFSVSSSLCFLRPYSLLPPDPRPNFSSISLLSSTPCPLHGKLPSSSALFCFVEFSQFPFLYSAPISAPLRLFSNFDHPSFPFPLSFTLRSSFCSPHSDVRAQTSLRTGFE